MAMRGVNNNDINACFNQSGRPFFTALADSNGRANAQTFLRIFAG